MKNQPLKLQDFIEEIDTVVCYFMVEILISTMKCCENHLSCIRIDDVF